MPWFKVDDQLATHPKTAKAGLAAMGLWVKAGSWSARHLTDGHIPAEMLPMFGANRRHAESLVKAGLWEADSDGWRFRDWTEYQPSAKDTELYQEALHDGAVRGNHERWHVKRRVFNAECALCVEESGE